MLTVSGGGPVARVNGLCVLELVVVEVVVLVHHWVVGELHLLADLRQVGQRSGQVTGVER